MVKKIIALIFFSVMLISAFFLLNKYYEKKTQHSPLKCKAFSKIEMETEYGYLSFSIIENIQLYDKDKGLLQFEGYVKNGSKKMYLDRTVYMHNTTPNDFVFIVDKIESSDADETPDEIFNQMWLELAGNDNLFNVSINEYHNNTLTIASPYASQFTCALY